MKRNFTKLFFCAALTVAVVGTTGASISVDAKSPFLPDGNFPRTSTSVEENLSFDNLYFHLDNIYESNDASKTKALVPFSFKCEDLFDLNNSSIQQLRTLTYNKNGRVTKDVRKMRVDIKTNLIYQNYTLHVPAEGYRQCFVKVDISDLIETFDFKNSDPLNGYSWDYSRREYNQVCAATKPFTNSHEWYAQFEVRLQEVDINSVCSANFVPFPEYTAVIRAYSKDKIDAIVESQKTLDSLTYGNYNFTYNGCGAIAANNALKIKTGTSNLYSVKKYFEDNNYLVLNGKLGTAPYGMTAFLESNNLIPSHEYAAQTNEAAVAWEYYFNQDYGKTNEINKKLSEKESALAVIFVKNNSNDLYAGAHYFVVEKKNGHYRTYNNGQVNQYFTAVTGDTGFMKNSLCLAYWIIG